MSNTGTKLADFLGKLQDRLNRVGLQASQTSSAVSVLRDDTRVRTDKLAEETTDLRTDVREANDRVDSLTTRHETLTTFVDGLRDDVVSAKASAVVLTDRLGAVEKVNDRREESQTLRDQNNVQALVNLRDSTAKGFDLVAADVAKLDRADKALSARVVNIEKFEADLVERAKRIVCTPAPAPSMPSDHVWVNKKLTGVYDTTTDLEQRLSNLEYRMIPKSVAPGTSWDWKRVDELVARVEELEVRASTPLIRYGIDFAHGIQEPNQLSYCGFNVRYKGSKLILEDKDDIEIFYLPLSAGEIVKIQNRPYGVQISLKRGDQYCLTGGPGLFYMNLMCLVKA